MNKPNILNKLTAGLVAVAAGLVLTAGVASAIPYTGDTTHASPIPAFNVFTGDVPLPAPVGGEAGFYQGRAPIDNNINDGTTPFGDPISTTCSNGQLLQMRVYVHNGASASGNDNGNGPSVAHGTKVKISLPTNEATSFSSSATISADNAASVYDNLAINCNGQKVKLEYVNATQYSKNSGVTQLNSNILGAGVPIQSRSVSGDVWGCWDDRVYVVLVVKVVKVETPPPVAAKCEMFSITADKNRTVNVNSFKYSASNAQVKNVVINWGDGKSTTVEDATKVVGQSHQYGADGTYNVTATVRFTVEGQADIVSGGAGTSCSQAVTFKSGKVVPPPTTPVGPTTLVNTGPGQVAGIFAAVTAAGTLGYRRMLARRLGSL